jgi:hypothetical protein
MAEGKRRSDVKKFAHRTIYPRRQRPVQVSLFGDVLNSRRDWICNLSGASSPAAGTKVIVRVDASNGADVLWGNQLVAKVSDPLGGELVDAIVLSDHPNSILVATVTSTDESRRQFAVRFGSDGETIAP